MKTICIDARMLYASGIGTYLQNILPFLENQYKLILLGNEEELSGMNLKNANIINLDSSIYSLKEQYQLPTNIPSCDLFWSPHYNVPVFPIKAKKRITTIHDVFHLKFFDTLSLSQKIYAKVLLNLATRLSDEIITVSHFSKKEIIKYLSTREDKIQVIHNGVSGRFHIIESDEQKNRFITKYGLPNDFILFVGNVKPHKNITNLIKAFSILKSNKDFQNYKLVIAGKRKGLITGTTDLDELINNLNLSQEIIFLEEMGMSEIPMLYNVAKLLVFPSFYEGFGLPPLEAMSCGCPTVVSDIECLKEIYEDSTIYTYPSKPHEISKSIESVLLNDNLRDELIEKGKNHAKKFTWEASAKHHLHIFEKALK